MTLPLIKAAYEFKIQLERYLSELEWSEVRTLAEVVAWNKAHAAVELPPGTGFPSSLSTVS